MMYIRGKERRKKKKKKSSKKFGIRQLKVSFFPLDCIHSLQGIHRFSVYLCSITNEVTTNTVKKRERHVLMHALGVFTCIEAKFVDQQEYQQ